MGNQNQKGTVQQQQQHPVQEMQEEIYHMANEKLLHSLISRGKVPAQPPAPPQKGKQRKLSMIPAHGQEQESSTELKTDRSMTKMPDVQTRVGYPECCVGYVEAEDEGQILSTGTAFLIHKQLALTCAHNCMKFDSRKEYSSLHVVFRGQLAPIRVKVKKAHYLDGLFQGEGLVKSENYLDFSVLELQKPMDDQMGYLGVAFDYDRLDPTSQVTIVGYEGERSQLCRTNTKLTSMSPKVFGINGKLDPKSYGAPVMVQVQGQWLVFGIVLWADSSDPEVTKGFKLYRFLYELLNNNFSKKVGHLNLKYRWVCNEKLERIMKQKYQIVTDLILEGNRIGPTGMSHLVNGTWKDLRQINLSNNTIQDTGLEILCAGNWPKLTALRLGNNNITTQGVQFLKKTNWTQLRHLAINENKIGNKGMEDILSGPWKNMIELDLFQTHINQEAVKALVKANYTDLMVLNLGANRIRQQGIKALVTSQYTDLHTLILTEASLNDAAVSHLEQANWPQLRQLDLSRNHLTHEGVEVLIRCDWRKLRDLNLRQNKITMKGLSGMKNSSWALLEQIDVRWNSLTEKDRESMRASFKQTFPNLNAYL